MTALFHYPADVTRRADLSFILYRPARFVASGLVRRRDHAVIGAAHVLQMYSLYESPPGTLPEDEAALASLALCGDDLERWRGLRARGALNGWVPCLCPSGGEQPPVRRLYHPSVLEAIRKALETETSAKADADRARLSRLRKALSGIGYGPPFTGDAQTVEWIDAILLDRLGAKARRSREAIAEAAAFVSARMDGGAVDLATERARRGPSPG